MIHHDDTEIRTPTAEERADQARRVREYLSAEPPLTPDTLITLEAQYVLRQWSVAERKAAFKQIYDVPTSSAPLWRIEVKCEECDAVAILSLPKTKVLEFITSTNRPPRYIGLANRTPGKWWCDSCEHIRERKINSLVRAHNQDMERKNQQQREEHTRTAIWLMTHPSGTPYPSHISDYDISVNFVMGSLSYNLDIEKIRRFADEDSYTSSEWWRLLQLKVEYARGEQCALCPATNNLSLYHTTKENLFDEGRHLGDVVLLCPRCRAVSKGGAV